MYLTLITAQCEDGILGNRWLLGDSAYLDRPDRSYLLTPLLNPSTSQEIRYNEAYIKLETQLKGKITIL